MKIFVSYSRRDAGDFANQIHESLRDEHQVFTDINNIQLGEIWSNTIDTNISNCDIFIVLVTNSALRSPHVEKEVLQAKKENKKIIPCIYRGIRKDEIKWGLERIQGIEFYDKYELARILYSKMQKGKTDVTSGQRKLSRITDKRKLIIMGIIGTIAILGIIFGVIKSELAMKNEFVPEPPVSPENDNGSELTVNEDAKNTIINLDSYFRGLENPTRFMYAISDNSNPSLVEGFINGTTLILSYLPHQSGLADISVRATDSTSHSVVSTFKVRVLPINDKPIVSIIQPKNNSLFNENEEIFFSADSSDLEEGDISKSIKWSSNIDGKIWQGSSFSHPLSLGNHIITASAKDRAGVITDSKILIKVHPIDRPPVIESISISPKSPQSNNNVTLLAKVTDEGKNSNIDLKYQWKQISGPQIDIINANTNNPSFIAPEVTDVSDIEIVLIVTDKVNNSDSTTKRVEIHP